MDTQISFGIEETTDGFLAYQLQNPSCYVWGIERSGFFNGREKWAKGFENQRV